jgi:hypothetical protein
VPPLPKISISYPLQLLFYTAVFNLQEAQSFHRCRGYRFGRWALGWQVLICPTKETTLPTKAPGVSGWLRSEHSEAV